MRRAVLMVVDGLRADLVTPQWAPNLHALAVESRWFRDQRSVFPSATRVNSASIATGCLPAAHGLAGNTIALDEGDGLRAVSVGPAGFRERWRRATGRTLLRPTLAERLRPHGGVAIYSNSSPGAAHMQDPDGHGWLYHRAGSHTPGLVPVEGEARLDVSYDAAGDAVTTQRLCAALEAPGPHRLLTLWICEPDHSQHQLELGSPAHRALVARADERVLEVRGAVERLRARGEHVLLIVCSDHGHETVDEIVPVAERLVEAGLKDAPDSSDVVIASSGMGALVYLSDAARPREAAIAGWLRAQPWCAEVFAGPELARVGQRAAGGLAIAFGMAKRDVPNRHGMPGLGHVAGSRFMNTDAPGRGQHGGLGPYEAHAVLVVNGAGVTPGEVRAATRVVDIAPTILAHLQLPAEGMDGRPLPLG